MSFTTAVQTSSVGHALSLDETLQDYTLHLSASSPDAVEPNALDLDAPGTQIVQTHQNPPNWPTDFRRIPPYRPINHNLDLSERPNGSNTAELIFVFVMLNGVRLQSVGKNPPPHYECASFQAFFSFFFSTLTRDGKLIKVNPRDSSARGRAQEVDGIRS